MSSRRMMMAYILTHQSRLPAEFQEVEWIGSSGTQYIDTGVILNTAYEIETTFLTIGAYNQTFMGNNKMRLYTFDYTSNRIYAIGDLSAYLQTTFINNKQTYTLSNTTGGSLGTFTDGINSITTRQAFATTTWKLFCDDSATQFSHMQLYYTKITRNGVVVREYIPCYRKADGVIGAYDLVNGVFYTNAGTGNFTKGADVV